MPVTLIGSKWVSGALRFFNKSSGASVLDIATTGATLTGGLTQTGDIALTGDITQTGDIGLTGDITQTGNIGLTGDITQTGNIGLTGDITQTGNIGLTGNITQTGDIGLTGDLTVSGAVNRTGQVRIINTEAKIGATAGWTLGGGAVNTGLMATCPASQTAATLVVPIPGLKVGDTITAFQVNGQIESASGAVTFDADLRKMTAAAAGSTDASVGAITQISKTADYKVADAKSSLAEVVAIDESFYVLLTATTAASTDIELVNISVTVTEA